MCPYSQLHCTALTTYAGAVPCNQDQMLIILFQHFPRLSSNHPQLGTHN